MKQAREYAGPWACVACGSRLWANTSRRDRRPRQRCAACREGWMVPERRTEARTGQQPERRTLHTTTL